MKPILALSVLFLVISFVAANDKDAVKKDLAKFQGSWIFESIEFEGEKQPIETLKGSKLSVKDNTFTLCTETLVFYKGTIKLDPTKKLKEIDVTFTDGPEKGKTRLGIYDLDNDTYRLCLNVKGNDRPTEFTAKKDSGQAVEVMKKENK
jgi:uncharacterized protein (TIGR03067 family)